MNNPATLRTGDLIFFARLPHRCLFTRDWAGYLSNSLIAGSQRLAQRSKRNYWNLIHVGMAEAHANGDVYLHEFTAGQRGTGSPLLKTRIAGNPDTGWPGYPGAVWHFPLKESERSKLDTAKLLAFIDSVQDCTYNVPGLLAAVTKLGYKGWPIDGQYFCSEFCVKALTMAGVLPQTVEGCSPDGQRQVPIDSLPQQYNPCELADISALFDNSECRMIGYGGKLLRPLVAG